MLWKSIENIEGSYTDKSKHHDKILHKMENHIGSRVTAQIVSLPSQTLVGCDIEKPRYMLCQKSWIVGYYHCPPISNRVL